MGVLTQYDSVTVNTVPASPQAVAGYTSGWWPTFEPLCSKFPHAFHLSIAVDANHSARCLDIESGDATIQQAPWWYFNRAVKVQGKPVLYTSASNIDALVREMDAAGVGRGNYYLWSAHYTYTPHVCGPGRCQYPLVDMTQYTDKALGRNLDASVVNSYVFVQPAKPDPFKYSRYATGPFTFGAARTWGGPLTLNERATVQEYDRLFQHSKQHKDRIAVLREHIKILRDRISSVAHESDPADWDTAFRGWRWQKLNDRLHGAVKLS